MMTSERGKQAETVQARRSAHPRPGKRLPAAKLSARAGSWLQRRSTRTTAPANATGASGPVAATPYTLVTTFRRDGTPVATPVWAAERDGRLYIRAERQCGKVKRLRRDPRALVAPCTSRGAPLAPSTPATGRVLSPQDEPAAEQTLAQRYGLGRSVFERVIDWLRVDMCYLELTPDPNGQEI